jgi:outer membrane receptor protein involved in Fe transport
MVEYYEEDSNRSRSQKQLCSKDTTNPDFMALGCTPEALGLEQPYSGATAFQILASAELGGLADGGTGAISTFSTGSLFVDANLGVTTDPDLRKVSLDFDPEYAGDQTLARFQIQHDFDQHTLTLLTGYSEGSTVSRQDYDGVVGGVLTMGGWGPGVYDGAIDGAGCGFGPGLPFDCFDMDTAVPGLIDNGITTPAEAAIMAELMANFAATGDPYGTPGPFTGTYSMGLFPISEPNPDAFDTGIWGGSILGFSDRAVAYDQSDGYNNNFSQEIRINSNFDGAFNYVLGGFYMRQESGGSYYVMQTALDQLAANFSAATNVGSGAIFGAPVPVFALSSPYFRTDTKKYDLKSWAIFGEGYYEIYDDLKLTVGLRYTEDDKSISSRNPLFATLSTCAAVAVDCPPYLHQENKWGEMTGRIGVDWDADFSFTDSTLLYGFFSRGYKGGGFNPPFTAEQEELAGLAGIGVDTGTTFEPEFLKSFEVGMKNTLLDGSLRLNLSAFHYTYEGMQVTNIVLNNSVNENTDAKLYGVEVEWIYAPNENLMFNGNVSYLNSDAEGSFLDPANPTGALSTAASEVALFKDINLTTSGGNCVYINDGLAPAAFDAAVAFALGLAGIPGTPFASCPGMGLVALGMPDVSFSLGVDSVIDGNQLPMSPEFSFKIGGQYTHYFDNEGTLTGRVDYFWQDDMYARLFNGPTDLIESWDTWNAAITYNAPDEAWFVRAGIKNILDDDHITGSYKTSPSTGLFTNIFTLDPRTYGVTVGFNF